MKKLVYYHPSPGVSDLGDLHFPVKKNVESPIKKTGIGMCPAWNHQNSRSFTYYSSAHLQFDYDSESNRFRASTRDIQEFVQVISIPKEDGCLVFEIATVFTNFYWTEEKNVWISILPHPLTTLNNNFYHCGAQFNLSNWARDVNIGAIVVDPSQPIIINRGDPLYIIKFHTEDQNDEFDLSYADLNESKWKESTNKINYVRSAFGYGFDYTKHLFESKPKSKCPFRFLK